MNPYQLYENREREAIPVSRLRTIRVKLQGMVNSLDDDERVYVNGTTFTADEFRFMLSCLKEPSQ